MLISRVPITIPGMVTRAATAQEISRFHEMVVFLRADAHHPTIIVQSAAGQRLAEIRIHDRQIIRGDLGTLDRMSLDEWLSLHSDDIIEAWRQCRRGESPNRVAALPEDWPIGGPSPIRATSVRPLEGYRLRVEWEDGSTGELDLGFLADHPSFQAWKDREKFQAVRVSGSSFTWGEGMEVCAWLDCWPERTLAGKTAGAAP